MPKAFFFGMAEGRMQSHKPFVLFVCRHNTGRSQMAEAYLRHFAGEAVEVASAGSTPGEKIEPVVVLAMAEVGIDVSAAQTKLIEKGVADRADLVITMGCDVHGVRRVDDDWDIPDPKGQSLSRVREIRDMIKHKARELASSLKQGTTMKRRVLFVCVRNAARSQMAEAFLNSICPDEFEAASAGLEPGELDPLAVEVMHEVGIDISRNQTKSVFDLFKTGKLFAYVVTVCDEASAERCPIFPGVTKRLHWSFADPAALRGSWDERLAQARIIRDQIHDRIAVWCDTMCARAPISV
jgi:arsenate reductase